MRNYLVLALCSLMIQAFAFGQNESAKRVVAIKNTSHKISIEQEQWLRQNYQHIVAMKKDSARIEIKKNFSSASNSLVEAMISRASKLMQEDKQKHRAQAQQMMAALTAQKNTLNKQITDKEKELKRTKDQSRIKSLKDEIAELKNKVKDVDKEIKYLHDSK